MCPKMRPEGVTIRKEKRQKRSCVILAIRPGHKRRHSSLRFCMRGHVWQLVIYLKFHEKRSSGFRALGVENRSLPLTLAYTTLKTAGTIPYNP